MHFLAYATYVLLLVHMSETKRRKPKVAHDDPDFDGSESELSKEAAKVAANAKKGPFPIPVPPCDPHCIYSAYGEKYEKVNPGLPGEVYCKVKTTGNCEPNMCGPKHSYTCPPWYQCHRCQRKYKYVYYRFRVFDGCHCLPVPRPKPWESFSVRNNQSPVQGTAREAVPSSAQEPASGP